MKKIRLPFFKRQSGGRTVKFSIAFKTSAIYTTLFGVILAVSIGVMTWALAERASHIQRLDRLSSFLTDRLSHDDAGQFDLDSFAQANNIYIEIGGKRGDSPLTYGTKPESGKRYNETMRRLDLQGVPLFVRIVDKEELGIAGNLTVSGFLVFLVLMLLLAAFFGALLMRKMMRPVYDMTRTARSISASDLSRRIDNVNSHDELNELAETFNEMLDRIQKSYEQQNRFVSDASHELRTPLSVISGYANLLRRWGSEDKEVLDESISKIVEEADSMQQLVERLLFLARADKQTQQVNFEEFCASDMMREIAAETRMIDEDHQIAEEIEPDVFLNADHALIKQAVRAVVENSSKYTPAGGTITISCRQSSGDRTELTVTDTGIGISEKDLPHIFDRFYKADESRTRGQKGSSGLGLSIVKWIVERHGGEIRVESQQGHGTATKIFLPKKENLLSNETYSNSI
ncbi:MAG TPA: ATP-binding protein [Caproicibacter sp.]|nr:ATP-binding protein [Caproicibacter sp.]